MRAPSTSDQALAWHTLIIAEMKRHAGKTPLNRIDTKAVLRQITQERPELAPHPEEPQAGFYRRRLVRGGPFVPARIWIEGTVNASGELIADETFCCEVDGRRADAWDQWPFLMMEPITGDEFAFMCANASWARRHNRGDPAASPGKPIDWLTAPIATPDTKTRKP